MTVFGRYAGFYDTLYREKDYEAECDFLEKAFHRYAQGPVNTILDLGCGTGGHAFPLSRRGYRVTGVDRSEEMVEVARAKRSPEHSNTPEFHRGDIRDLELGTTFDAVISMFAVISYLTTNEDLEAALRTVHRHLKPNGISIFDAWFGPAVLSEKPSDRYKIIETNGERILRFAHPELDVIHHTVQVNYKLLQLKADRLVEEIQETHYMRYLFPQEIAYFLEKNGLRPEWMGPFPELDGELSERDWNVAIVARAGN